MTPKLLDKLQEEGVKATFFVNGYRFDEDVDARSSLLCMNADGKNDCKNYDRSNVPKNIETLKRIHAEGHDIGSHTYGHVSLGQDGHRAPKTAISINNA